MASTVAKHVIVNGYGLFICVVPNTCGHVGTGKNFEASLLMFFHWYEARTVPAHAYLSIHFKSCL